MRLAFLILVMFLGLGGLWWFKWKKPREKRRRLRNLKEELQAIGDKTVLDYKAVREAKEKLDAWKIRAHRTLEKLYGPAEAGRFQKIVAGLEERDGCRQPGVGPVRAFLEEKERYLDYLEGLLGHIKRLDKIRCLFLFRYIWRG